MQLSGSSTVRSMGAVGRFDFFFVEGRVFSRSVSSRKPHEELILVGMSGTVSLECRLPTGTPAELYILGGVSGTVGLG